MNKALLAVALVSTTVLGGCVIAVGPDGFDHGDSVSRSDSKMRAKIADLPLGESTASIRDQLGEPEFSEAFTGKDGEYRVWFYRTHRVDSDGETRRDETTPLVFRDGKLTAIGDGAYKQALMN